jgi:hypothetical protein
MEYYYDISASFTIHVITKININIRLDYVLQAAFRYITILRE